jgi:hypothetical protein
MAFDFPASPVNGEIFVDPTTGATWMWNSYAWGKGYSEPPAGIAHPPAETIPVDPPIDGMTNVNDVLMAFDAEIEQLSNEGTGKVEIAGDTMTGPLILSEHPTAASPALQAATKQYVGTVSLPSGGLAGEALVKDALNVPQWGAAIQGGNF